MRFSFTCNVEILYFVGARGVNLPHPVCIREAGGFVSRRSSSTARQAVYVIRFINEGLFLHSAFMWVLISVKAVEQRLCCFSPVFCNYSLATQGSLYSRFLILFFYGKFRVKCKGLISSKFVYLFGLVRVARKCGCSYLVNKLISNEVATKQNQN